MHRVKGSLIAAEDVFTGAALASALGVQLGGVDGQALVDVQARLLAGRRVQVADEAAAAHALVAGERLLAHRLAVRSANAHARSTWTSDGIFAATGTGAPCLQHGVRNSSGITVFHAARYQDGNSHR